jgi:uncharacterized protein (DUF488 family)
MQVYTSYYAKLSKIDLTVYTPIAISLTAPSSVRLINCRKLNPDRESFYKYKQNGDWERVKSEYNTKLQRYQSEDILNSLMYLSKGKIPVLMCWESSDKNCHRHIISEWLNEAGITCEELKIV